MGAPNWDAALEGVGMRRERAHYPLHPISTLFEQKSPELFAMVIIRTRWNVAVAPPTPIQPQIMSRVTHVKLLGDAQLVLIVRTVRENSDDPTDHHFPVENGMTWEIR